MYDPPQPVWMRLVEKMRVVPQKPRKEPPQEIPAAAPPPPPEPQETPRLAPDQAFPPYAYVSGQFPHPESDPSGHSFGKKKVMCEPLQPEEWEQSSAYLWGLDLFNHGYYWEAHEAWEGLWRAVDRKGLVARFLQGLIRLAAAGVKARERIAEGVQSHARRSHELFQDVAANLSQPLFLGLPVAELAAFAGQMEKQPILGNAPKGTPVEIVFQLVLIPEAVQGD
jgi:predicted metal-dependent hydrolase